MILQSESGLSEGEYNALLAARQNASYQVLAYQWNPTFALTDEGGTASPLFDADYFDGLFWRVTPDGLQTWTGSAWTDVADWAWPGTLREGVTPLLAVDDTRLAVFAATSTTLYRRVWDGGNWDDWESIHSEGDLAFWAAVDPDRLYAVAYDSDDYWYTPYQLYWDGEAWEAVDSGIVWPFPIDSFDAVALADGADSLILTSMLPGNIQTRALNTRVVKKIIPSGGVVAFTVRDHEFSDHVPVDVLDELAPWRYRRAARINRIGDTLYALVYGGDGTKLSHFAGYRLYTSKDGLNWSRGELFRFGGNINRFGALLFRVDDQLYAFTSNQLFEAPSTLMFGVAAADTYLNITTSILRYEAATSGILQVGIDLDDYGSPWTGTFLDGRHIVALRVFDGYTPPGEAAPVFVQTGLLEVDSYEWLPVLEQNRRYREVLRLTARDRISWLGDRTQSEQFLVRNPQAVGADDYTDDTATGYGGQAHSATWDGSWRTVNNALELWSNNEEGQAASTHKIDLWNFQHSVEFRLSQIANDEYAGLFFRAQDKDNTWLAVYDQASDTCRLIQRSAGVDTVRATTGAMGWSGSPETTRYLLVRGYYAQVEVFTSDDGLNWNDAPLLAYTMPGQPPLPDYSDVPVDEDGFPTEEADPGDLPPLVVHSGYVGVLGRGYAPDIDWDFDFTFQLPQWLWDWDFSFYDFPAFYVDGVLDDEETVDPEPTPEGLSYVSIAFARPPLASYSDHQNWSYTIPLGAIDNSRHGSTSDLDYYAFDSRLLIARGSHVGDIEVKILITFDTLLSTNAIPGSRWFVFANGTGSGSEPTTIHWQLFGEGMTYLGESTHTQNSMLQPEPATDLPEVDGIKYAYLTVSTPRDNLDIRNIAINAHGPDMPGGGNGEILPFEVHHVQMYIGWWWYEPEEGLDITAMYFDDDIATTYLTPLVPGITDGYDEGFAVSLERKVDGSPWVDPYGNLDGEMQVGPGSYGEMEATLSIDVKPRYPNGIRMAVGPMTYWDTELWSYNTEIFYEVQFTLYNLNDVAVWTWTSPELSSYEFGGWFGNAIPWPDVRNIGKITVAVRNTDPFVVLPDEWAGITMRFHDFHFQIEGPEPEPDPWDWEYTVDFTQEAGLWTEHEYMIGVSGIVRPGRIDGVGWKSWTRESSNQRGLRLELRTPGGYDPELTITQVVVIWQVTDGEPLGTPIEGWQIGSTIFNGTGASPNSEYWGEAEDSPFEESVRTSVFTHPGYTGLYSIYLQHHASASAPEVVIRSVTVRGLGENPYV